MAGGGENPYRSRAKQKMKAVKPSFGKVPPLGQGVVKGAKNVGGARKLFPKGPAKGVDRQTPARALQAQRVAAVGKMQAAKAGAPRAGASRYTPDRGKSSKTYFPRPDGPLVGPYRKRRA